MTTIAYRDGILASDSRLTFKSNVTTDKCKKIWRLSDGTLFGASGDNEGGLALLKALKDGREIGPKSDREFCGVRIIPKGRIYTTEGLVWARWPEPFIAIGSGGKYARAAMLAGASAVEAVRIGIASDVYSGGRVQTLRLKR